LSRVIHFEISADDLKRASKFYGNVFSWKIEKWDTFEYWTVTTGKDDDQVLMGL
jgi:uncharacterized protein